MYFNSVIHSYTNIKMIINVLESISAMNILFLATSYDMFGEEVDKNTSLNFAFPFLASKHNKGVCLCQMR